MIFVFHKIYNDEKQISYDSEAITYYMRKISRNFIAAGNLKIDENRLLWLNY